MHLVFSVPSGFHARELLLPLKSLLEQDAAIQRVTVITPGAPYQAEIFPAYSQKFTFENNPTTPKEHEKLLQRVQPSLLITTTSGLDDKDVPILKAARLLNLPTFTFVASWDNVWKMERLKNESRSPSQPAGRQVLADHMAVWNTMMRDHLLRVFPDLTSERITITGAPRLDFFTHAEKIPTRKQLFAALGFSDPTGKLVHLATTELYSSDYLVRTLAPLPIKMYVSVHPGGNLEKHKKYAESHGAIARYSFGRHAAAPVPAFLYNPSLDDVYMLVALFKHTDVLVNHSSTVAIESLLADRPVINVKYGRRFDWWRWYRSMVYRDFQQHYRDVINYGATKVVYSARQLTQTLQNYLKHPEEQSTERAVTVKKMITTTDGTASQKMLALIKRSAI